MGVHAEQEHTETYKKIYDHEITPEEAPLYVAVDHLKEMDDYYTRLAQMEGMKDGGKIAQVMREFKEGDLKSSSGEKVTDVEQAIAIGLSEQRRHEAEKKFGGVVRCSKCNHSWHRVDNHTTDVNVCHKCGQDNSEHVKLFEEGGYVEIEKTDKMKSNIFFNTDILKSNGDYILGGFNANDLNYIDVDGDSSLLSMPKLKLIFKRRLTTAINEFKKEIRANVISRSNEAVEKYYIEEVVENELSNLLETYLDVTTVDFDTEDLVHLIQNDGSYETWVERVRTRMEANRKRIDFSNENINKVGTSSGIDIEEAEDNTYNATLEQMLEQLKNITEENTI
jgi:ssDNA-binding Zn-finger/Zn-ribbon topoisomerase 1